MEYLDKIKEACLNHQYPDIIWLEELETYIENIEIRKALNAESVLKYSQTEGGKKKRREAQARYYKRQKDLNKELLIPKVNV
jgi:hypothetical protein